MKKHKLSQRRRMLGQSMIEYVIVTAFAVLVLIQSTNTESSVIQSVVTAVKNAYKGFTYSQSYATNLTVF